MFGSSWNIYAVPCFLLLLPWNVSSMHFQTTCDRVKLPRECQCQANRQLTSDAFNETRLRCRQLTEIKPNYDWSKIIYDRLIFESSNENLTLHRFVFVDLIVRTLHFQIANLFLEDHTFDHAHIGQLSIFNHETYARIDFQSSSQIFYGSTITNLHFKSIDFQTPISEWIFSNAKIFIFLIESSKFSGFSNRNRPKFFPSQTRMKYDHFLEYDSFLLSNRSVFSSFDDSSSIESEQTVIMNITSINSPISITIYTIISSINTTKLTENYFPNNLDYSRLEEIELSFNSIDFLAADVFRYLKAFQGRLILRNNQLHGLDIHAFDHLFLLRNLSLAKNYLQNISSRHFHDLMLLKELDLSFNRISQLEKNTFEYLSNLEILYLNSNPLKFIHPETFSNLTRLKSIHFQDVQFIHLIDQRYSQWIWNLASLHLTPLRRNDFDLSDVAFCILSRYNQSLFHFSREYSCSCNIHYFNLNQNVLENSSSSSSHSIVQYQSNYLRLTPLCQENGTEAIVEEYTEENDLILQNLENRCNYKLMFLDCDAMTTTTTEQTTTLFEIEVQTTENADTSIEFIVESIPPSTTSRSGGNQSVVDHLTRKTSLNNIRKLFIVLGTLVAITIFAIILVFVWYRVKTIIKRRKKKQSFVEQEQHFNSPAFNKHQSTTLRETSSDMSGSLYSGQISTTKSQSEALIEPLASITYKNLDTIDNVETLQVNSMNRNSIGI